jgi:hypothetical protein
MNYKLKEGGGVMRSDGAGIPPDPANYDWLRYLDWVAAGNVPVPLETPLTEDFFDGYSAVQQL